MNAVSEVNTYLKVEATYLNNLSTQLLYSMPKRFFVVLKNKNESIYDRLSVDKKRQENIKDSCCWGPFNLNKINVYYMSLF